MVQVHLSTQANNKALVQASFDRWRSGTGSPFELLSPEVEWGIVSSPPARLGAPPPPVITTYHGQRQFLDEVVQPLNGRLATPLLPTVRAIYADGDTVIVLFDVAAAMRCGMNYYNTYAWFLEIKQARVVSVIAFFDTVVCEYSTYVAPAYRIYGSPTAGDRLATQANNKALVQASFDRWKSGTGGPFELLSAEVEWTIVEHFESKTYRGREKFLDYIIRPLNARMQTPFVPTVRHIYAEGDAVVILFDAAGTPRGGFPYRNTYAWFFEMSEAKVVNLVAYFDTMMAVARDWDSDQGDIRGAALL